jgi:hypothetical protein
MYAGTALSVAGEAWLVTIVCRALFVKGFHLGISLVKAAKTRHIKP